MTDLESRRYQMLVRVRDFCLARAADFGVNSLFAQLLASLTAIIVRIDGLFATQASGMGTAREGSESRGAAREALREMMVAIRDTARTMAEDTPGLQNKFRIPPSNNDQQLIVAARSFAADAAPLSAQFIARELPANFIDELNTRIANLERAISHQSSAVGDHVGAGEAVDDALSEGLVMVRSLHPIIKNKYAHDSATLAEWTSASHTERSPKHKPTPPATPPAQPPPG